ncbi:MAG: 3'-5' exonuclease [Synergistaceae bacterium]|nr:3'-5' exonuclease [Synergistaceae bacterium]MBQ6973035.1 3'-5' exonuclease [Synergistaceae bacterium]
MAEVIREFRGLSYVDFPSDYCLVDIETTGLGLYDSDIIEIGAVKYSGGKPAGQFQTLIQPPRRDGVFVDEFIVGLTGITNEMLSDAPRTSSAIKGFADFLGDSVIVGYNVSFDVNFLYDSFMKHLKRPLTNNFIDVLRISRRLCAELPSRDIDSVLEHFGLEVEGRHRAIGDCIATQLIYERLQEEALRNYGALEDFSKTFKACSVRKPKRITCETFAEWRTQLYGCKSVKNAFRSLEKLRLTAVELRKFAEYVGVSVHKYAGKNDIITALVYRMIDDKLSA